MKRTTLSAIAVALAAPMLVASVQAASATAPGASKGHPAHVSKVQHRSSKMPLVPQGALKGYQQVTSALLADPAGAQVSGSVACPGTTHVVGGGAVISGTSLAENLNASVPFSDGSGWIVYVNNASGTAGTFAVYAVCATNILSYSVVTSAPTDNPAGLQTQVPVTCPQGSAPLGGGGVASSGDTAVNLNSSFPLKKGWRVDVNNGSGGGDTVTTYAICGVKPKNYIQVAGTPATNGASSQTPASASCPTGTQVFGGGALSGSSSTVVDLNSSVPSGTATWVAYENNNSASDASLTAYAVCGKVKA
jgi:hypothetical protein